MRRYGIISLLMCAFFGMTTALPAADDASRPKPIPKTAIAVSFSADSAADSPLVRAAKVGLEARKHPRSRIIIDSNTLIVSYRHESDTAVAAAPASPETQGRSWASGNQGDAAAIASRERNQREQAAAAEKSRVEQLRQEQSYMASQALEPYAEMLDDQIEKRLEAIPGEIKTKPPQ